MIAAYCKDIKIQLPEKVAYIIETIQDAGYEAYAVGGCVRDSILGRVPDDWDITTSARPEQVKELFRRTVDTGLQHGTVTVLLDKDGFEVTTYRIDGEYEDSRHPSHVIFTSNLLEDLKRRDFTINAMAYNQQVGLVDAFGGLQDMEKGVIRCVGDAMERFGEDALRMMRAVRFGAQLGYEIAPQTREGIRRLAPTLQNISAERIQTELVKLLISPHPEELDTARKLGILAVILPEFEGADTWGHILHCLRQVPGDKVLRLTMLFQSLGKVACEMSDEDPEDIARKVLRRLKFDNDTIYKVTRLVRYRDYGKDQVPDRSIVRKGIYEMGKELFPLYLQVRRADLMAQNCSAQEEKLAQVEAWGAAYEEIMGLQECVCLKDLAVTGKDLILAGMKPGPSLGELLQRLLEDVLENPSHNTREYLLALAVKQIP